MATEGHLRGIGTMARNPVCGVVLKRQSADATSEHQGKTHYFCSRDCQSLFDENPAGISEAKARYVKTHRPFDVSCKNPLRPGEFSRRGQSFAMGVQSTYRVLAPGYDRLRPLWADGRLGDAERFLQSGVLPRYCLAGGAVLDLGCGTGANLAKIVKMGIPIARYVGVDISPDMLGRARRRFSADARAEFYLGDLGRLPFGDGTFDFAICTWAMEHLPDVGIAVAEALRVLKPGASLTVLAHSLPRSPWRTFAHLAEPILWRLFQTRFLRPQDWVSSQATWRFAKDLHALYVLTGETQA